MMTVDLSAERFVEEFYDSFTRDAMAGEEEAADVVDRYCAPDIVQVADGIELDREKLIAHLRPVRKNLVSWRFEVHEAHRTGDRLAARFTIHAEMRRGQKVATEVYLFGELTPDGRLCRSNQLTRAGGQA